MTPLSTTRLFGRSSRKREAERTIAERMVVSNTTTTSIAAAFVILSGGVITVIEQAAESVPA